MLFLSRELETDWVCDFAFALRLRLRASFDGFSNYWIICAWICFSVCNYYSGLWTEVLSFWMRVMMY